MRSQDESVKLDDPVFHVGRESLSKSGLRSHGYGVVMFPVRVPAIGCFKFRVGAEFFCLELKHHAAN